MDDAALSTHAKARALFLDGWEGCHTLVMGGTGDATAEAQAYEAQLRALPAGVLPVGADGLPLFDMALIGVGDDGHVGSLYPNRNEVLDGTGREHPAPSKNSADPRACPPRPLPVLLTLRNLQPIHHLQRGALILRTLHCRRLQVGAARRDEDSRFHHALSWRDGGRSAGGGGGVRGFGQVPAGQVCRDEAGHRGRRDRVQLPRRGAAAGRHVDHRPSRCLPAQPRICKLKTSAARNRPE
eukprot:scaffold7936_cov116-Isochrysis_galbana.AAC.2